jgi:hypothetical protein
MFDTEARGYGALVADPELRRRFDLNDSYGFFHMLDAQVHGRVNSWAIRWYLTMFSQSALALFPARSLVENRGFGEGATHTTNEVVGREFLARAHNFAVQRFPAASVDTAALRRIERFLRWPRTVPARGIAKIRRLLSIRRR